MVNLHVESGNFDSEWSRDYWTRVRDSLKDRYMQAVMQGQLLPDVYSGDTDA